MFQRISGVCCMFIFAVVRGCFLKPGAEESPYLPRGLDALDDRHADQDPGHQQGQRHLPVQPAGVVNGAGDVESLAVPEVSGGRALLTFRHHDCGGVKEKSVRIRSVVAAML